MSKVKMAGRFILSIMGRSTHLEHRLRSGFELLKVRCVAVASGLFGIGYASAETCLRVGAEGIVASRSFTRAEEAAFRLSAGAFSGAALNLSNAEGMTVQVDAIHASSRAGGMRS